jgi:hypothetical protein
VNSNHRRARGELAQRWGSVAVGAAIFFVVGWMTLEAAGPARLPKKDLDAGTPATSAVAARESAPSRDAEAEERDGGLALDLPPSLGGFDAAIMPSSAPRTVKIGVVLVTYAGAEGAPPNARTKREALAIAERLGQDAKSDFHHAVTQGDPGSADDIGRLPRGVLDPRTEIGVFALGSGEVSDVFETPRGYWIVKRND